MVPSQTTRDESLTFSEVGLGCWAIGGPYWTDGEATGWSGPLDDDDIRSAIRLAVDDGITHFDTADVYGYGRSERLLGDALGGVRHDIVIATKIGWAATTAPHVYDPWNIKRQCEQSLRNLRRDQIDLYYIHQCDFGQDDRYLDAAVAAFDELRSSGKIRCIGLSGYSEEELLRIAPRVRPTVIQSWADIEHDEFVREGSQLREYMDAEGISFVAMMPFGQGRLLGKYSADAQPEFGDGDNRTDSAGFASASLRSLEPRLDKLRRRFGADTPDLARVALQFVLANPAVVSVIPGFRSTAQVKEILRAAQHAPLSPDDVRFVLEVFPREEMEPHPWAE